jgi:hypothetical protein
MLLFISRTSSTIDAELSKDASAVARTEKVSTARLTWALASTGVVALADWEVSLANSWHVAVGLADFKVNSVDSEQAGNPPFLFVGA